MLFHERTLDQIQYVRQRLLSKKSSSWSRCDFMTSAAVAGVLHGPSRADGSSAYLSISMPNTFSMSPAYVAKFIREHNLQRPEQDLFECLRDKIARSYLDALEGPIGSASMRDAAEVMSTMQGRTGEVDLLLTSPPYLQVVNYATSNWIRLWWLGLEDASRDAGAGRRQLDEQLDHKHTYASYLEFMKKTFMAASKVLKWDGIGVFVIGDVATPEAPKIALAEALWKDCGMETGLRLVDIIEDHLPVNHKVSRIWGETRGRATDRDCILVVGRQGGRPRNRRESIDWFETYKDAGPDDAHRRVMASRNRLTANAKDT
jgi:site-specific DNA-methyltransferase (adenine-specific)